VPRLRLEPSTYRIQDQDIILTPKCPILSYHSIVIILLLLRYSASKGKYFDMLHIQNVGCEVLMVAFKKLPASELYRRVVC
jgi:hypothetical protein